MSIKHLPDKPSQQVQVTGPMRLEGDTWLPQADLEDMLNTSSGSVVFVSGALIISRGNGLWDRFNLGEIRPSGV